MQPGNWQVMAYLFWFMVFNAHFQQYYGVVCCGFIFHISYSREMELAIRFWLKDDHAFPIIAFEGLS